VGRVTVGGEVPTVVAQTRSPPPFHRHGAYPLQPPAISAWLIREDVDPTRDALASLTVPWTARFTAGAGLGGAVAGMIAAESARHKFPATYNGAAIATESTRFSSQPLGSPVFVAKM